MIPSDLAARLRMLTEATFFEADQPVSATTRVREVQGRLPELAPGERFTATLQRPLADGTFQAIVAGRSYTLALNHPAKAGDTLELVVMRNTPRAVVAQLAHPPAIPAAPAPSAAPTLSSTGRLISFLLTGQPASPPATLAAGRPLVDTPPAAHAASTLAPALRDALTRSGLFYESHQLQWLSGKVETMSLRQEPQGQQPLLPPAAGARQPVPSGNVAATGLAGDGETLAESLSSPDDGPPLPVRASGEAPAERGTALPSRRSEANAAFALGSADEATQSSALQPGPARSQPQPQAMPDRLIPIVHQQLDAMATQNYLWQGQVWPGQTMEWEIEDPQRDRDGASDEPAEHWNTTLRLSLPRLGGLEARLVLSPAGVALRLIADEADSVSALEAARGQLDEALAAANLALNGFVAERRHGG